jgi:hypothetical protein
MAEALEWTTSGNDIYNANSGNVGIGMTSGAAYKLDVNGSIHATGARPRLLLQNTNSGGTTWRIASGDQNAEGYFGIYSDAASSYRLVIDSTGKVGIGTLTPGVRLQVDDPSVPALRFHLGTNTGYAQIQSSSANDLVFLTDGNNERMRITQGGNVGIGTGTTTPSDKLHISTLGDYGLVVETVAGHWPGMRFARAGVNKAWFALNPADDSLSVEALTDFYLRANNATRLTIASTGNVGIGTQTPSVPLHIGTDNSGPAPTVSDIRSKAYLRAGADGQWSGNVFFGSSAGSNFFWQQSGKWDLANNQLVPNYNYSINPLGGNVGIGTTSPNYKIDVAGDANATQFCISGDCRNSWAAVSGGSGGVAGHWTLTGSSLYPNSTAYKLGIGAQDPNFTAKLYVYSTVGNPSAGLVSIQSASSGGSNYPLLRIQTMSGGNDNDNNGIYMTAAPQGRALHVEDTFSNPLFTVLGNGNVGIGMSSPGAKLHVYSTVENPSAGLVSIQSASSGGNNYPLLRIRTVSGGNENDKNGIYMTAAPHGRAVYIEDTSSNPLFTVAGNGTVGIGMTCAATEPSGSLCVSGNIAAKYQDVAEWVPASQALAAGTVVVLDADHFNQVVPSAIAYDTRVAGVVSASPGIILGEAGADKVKVATTGRVKVKVDASQGAVQVGDLLVTGTQAGYAMKSQPVSVGGIPMHRPGTLIGKALEPLKEGAGEILVLLSLQ